MVDRFSSMSHFYSMQPFNFLLCILNISPVVLIQWITILTKTRKTIFIKKSNIKRHYEISYIHYTPNLENGIAINI